MVIIILESGQMRSIEGVDYETRLRIADLLLDQALKDELAGVAPWQASPFWGVGGTNPARGLRERMAAALGESPPTLAALPVVRWFLEREKLTRLQGQVLKGITGLQGPEAD